MIEKAPPHPGFPLHLFNKSQTKSWLILPGMRALAASNLSKKYPGGVGVLSPTLRLFIMVTPDGRYRELPPPHTKFMIHQVANAPYHWEECACRNYFDPEVQGPWRERGQDAGHHPMCQFNKTSVPVFQKCFDKAVHRKEAGQTPQERPDDWLIIQNEVRNS